MSGYSRKNGGEDWYIGCSRDNCIEFDTKFKCMTDAENAWNRRATPQEPKPMVEIDLDYVIKQKYIEREVLDKIREQIKSHLRGVEITLEVLVENDPLRPKFEGAKETLEECLELIDKAEAEANNG